MNLNKKIQNIFVFNKISFNFFLIGRILRSNKLFYNECL